MAWRPYRSSPLALPLPPLKRIRRLPGQLELPLEFEPRPSREDLHDGDADRNGGAAESVDLSVEPEWMKRIGRELHETALIDDE